MHLNATSGAAYVWIAKMNVVDTDFICLVTAQMSYFSNSMIKCKNLIKLSKDNANLQKKWLYNGKMPRKGKNLFRN